MGIEFELKYRADTGILQQLLQDIYGQEQRYEMQTTYYDTSSRSFSEKKCTLRRRLENGRSVCTLKTPGIGAARGEWELECEDIRIAFAALCKLTNDFDRTLLDPADLIPVCGAQFTRRCAVVDIDGAVVELALDEGILFSGDRQIPLGEMEVELKAGTDEAAIAFAQELAAEFGLVPEAKSKFARAMALAME